MEDLSGRSWKAPARVTLTGHYLTLVPYEKEKHLTGLWDALGGSQGINQLIQYFPNEDYTVADGLGDWINATGEVVGMASYMRIDAANGVCEVGSVAHGKAMARSPMSTELHYLMAKYVFDDLSYRRYEWKCHNDNMPSKNAALRYGFSFEGIFRQHMVSRGKNRDTAWFAIIDKEWPVVKAAYEAWLAPENFDADGRQKRKLEDIRRTLIKDAQ